MTRQGWGEEEEDNEKWHEVTNWVVSCRWEPSTLALCWWLKGACKITRTFIHRRQLMFNDWISSSAEMVSYLCLVGGGVVESDAHEYLFICEAGVNCAVLWLFSTWALTNNGGEVWMMPPAFKPVWTPHTFIVTNQPRNIFVTSLSHHLYIFIDNMRLRRSKSETGRSMLTTFPAGCPLRGKLPVKVSVKKGSLHSKQKL